LFRVCVLCRLLACI